MRTNIKCAIMAAGFWAAGIAGGAVMDDVAGLYEDGNRRMEAGDVSGALAAFDKAIAAAAACGDTNVLRMAAAARNNRGNILLLNGQLDAAAEEYGKALELDPVHARARANLGTCRLKQGRPADAIAEYEAAVRQNPADVLAMNNLAALLVDAGKLRLAAQYIEKSLRLEPRNEQALLTLAQIFHLQGNADGQQKVYEVLVDVTNGDPGALALLGAQYLKSDLLDQAGMVANRLAKAAPDAGRILAARIDAKAGRHGKAEGVLRGLVRVNPEDRSLLMDLLAVMLEQGKVTEALQEARAAVQVAPYEAGLWFFQGACEEKAGLLEEAERSYSKAVALDRTHAAAYNNLGILLAKRGNESAALDCFGRAVMADPGYADAKYNLGKALVITRVDYERGVRLLAHVGAGRGDAAARARTVIDDLEKIARGEDPGWNSKSLQN